VGRTIPALWNHDPYACSDLLISDHFVGARTRCKENEWKQRKRGHTRIQQVLTAARRPWDHPQP
jgi:hypothetical protein